MKAPKTTGQLRQSLAHILAGVVNGDIKEREARVALTAATRITESFQAEARIRQIAILNKEVPAQMGDLELSAAQQGE